MVPCRLICHTFPEDTVTAKSWCSILAHHKEREGRKRGGKGRMRVVGEGRGREASQASVAIWSNPNPDRPSLNLIFRTKHNIYPIPGQIVLQIFFNNCYLGLHKDMANMEKQRGRSFT